MEVKCIKKEGFRPFYDSTWMIEFDTGEVVHLVRDDLEDAESLRAAVLNCKTMEDVKKLDCCNRILYD